MADLKPELASRSKYWISRHRYYELKHYCLQYPEWKKLYLDLDFKLESKIFEKVKGGDLVDPTAKIGQMRADLYMAMDLIQRTAAEASKEFGAYIFKAVTENVPFIQLQTMYGIPCGKDMYYDAYRRFFWLLSEKKGI